ncbi:YbjN domain-containing protein [Paraurantiacibacter namhicola]|uniref:Bacterial sensory transduction regulator n=1 Tax=Paraurantiacibacter namhicola TaxID=645517 RepID=A0A1C7DAM4_9SPHN|nr:YbjN domain-containing protein [Paraurantiacibacter namhicola]ANU08536.1 hypothetical protein A6F65_02253 [Paraurantiacibacter namhicola]
MELKLDRRTAAEDTAPLDMLARLFDAHGWPCGFENDQELAGEIEGSWTKYQLRFVWRAEDRVLQLLCLPEIRVPDAKRRAACELLAMVNEQMWLGHFDVWSQGDMVLYRHGLLLGEDGTLDLGTAQFALDHAVSECDRFYPAFQFVLWGDKSPRAALDAALVDAAGEA